MAQHFKCMKCGWEETSHGDVIPLGQPESFQMAFFTPLPNRLASRFECGEYEPPVDESRPVPVSRQPSDVQSAV